MNKLENYYSSQTNEELIETLRWYGCDPYYKEDWNACVAEIERRLKNA